MKQRSLRHMLAAVAAVLIVAAGCTHSGRDGDTTHTTMPSDTLGTEEKAMACYATDLQKALSIIDSAKVEGRLTAEKADLLRATAYSRTYDAPRHDSAIVIAERLLRTGMAKEDPTFRQNVLEVLVYSSRQIEDYELQLAYSTQLADAYKQQRNEVEALRTEAEVGAVLYRIGRTGEGMAKIDSVIARLTPVRRFNELDASIIAMKRKVGVIRDYPQIAATAGQILECLDDYEKHPEDYHDASPREPKGEERPAYIAFYRAQAWAYLAAAYAHMQAPPSRMPQYHCGPAAAPHAQTQAQSLHYLSLAEQSAFGQTLSGKKMLAPTLCLLGEWEKMEAIYQELETVFKERGDTLTLDYAQLLLDRAKATKAQGRMAESIALLERHAMAVQQSQERLLKSKANLYAARYHEYEQQMAINRQQAELARKNIINISLTAAIAVLLAVMLYVIRQQHILRKKNSVLAREIYKGINKQALQAPQPPPQPPTTPREGGGSHSSPGASGDEVTTPLPPREGPAVGLEGLLFRQISEAVVRDRLFLDPTLNRQKLTECFSLTKEQIGAAFSKGSPYKSVTDFINDCRLPYAAKMLTERPDLSIAEVAEASGYARAATFTTNFKKRYTLTPAQYREKVLKGDEQRICLL